MSWHTGPLLAFDLETTGISTETDRIVSAAAIHLGGGQDTKPHTWLSDVDGHEIPAEATAVHGISTEQARAHGIPAKEVVEDIVYALDKATTEGTTKRAAWRKANPTRLVRLRPESIYAFAKDREDAIRLLRVYGYLTS